MFYNISFYLLHVYPLQHHLLLFYFPHEQHHPHVLASPMSFKSFTGCRILPASSIIYKQQTKKSGGVSFQDKKPIGLQMFKGQVPIGNGCGPWTWHANISWHLTPSYLPLFISSHLISSSSQLTTSQPHLILLISSSFSSSSGPAHPDLILLILIWFFSSLSDPHPILLIFIWSSLPHLTLVILIWSSSGPSQPFLILIRSFSSSSDPHPILLILIWSSSDPFHLTSSSSGPSHLIFIGTFLV